MFDKLGPWQNSESTFYTSIDHNMLSEMGRANTMTWSDHQLLDSLAVLETRKKRRRGSEPSPSKCLSRVSCHSLPLWPWGRKNFAMDPHWGRPVISSHGRSFLCQDELNTSWPPTTTWLYDTIWICILYYTIQYYTIWYYRLGCILYYMILYDKYGMEVDNPTNPMASASKIVPSGHESQRRVSGRVPLGQTPTFSWQRPGWPAVWARGTSQNIPNPTKKHRWLRVETSVIYSHFLIIPSYSSRMVEDKKPWNHQPDQRCGASQPTTGPGPRTIERGWPHHPYYRDGSTPCHRYFYWPKKQLMRLCTYGRHVSCHFDSVY